MPKCKRCTRSVQESTPQYFKRVKFDFGAPFICRECIRIYRIMNFSEDLEKVEKARKEQLKTVTSIPYLMRKYRLSWEEAKKKKEEEYK